MPYSFKKLDDASLLSLIKCFIDKLNELKYA